VKWASQRVFDFVLMNCRKAALTSYGKFGHHEYVEMGIAAKVRFFHDLECGGLTFNCWKMKENATEAAVATSLEIPKPRMTLRPETAFETYECMAKLFQDSTNDNTLILCPPTFPAVDAIGFGRRIFRVIVNKNHSLDPEGMKKILVSAGILTANGKNIKEGAKNITLYWVVLPGIVNRWKDHVQNKCEDDRYILQDAIKFVEQVVLELPVDNILDEESNAREMFGLQEDYDSE